jgi:hypothetical protein
MVTDVSLLTNPDAPPAFHLLAKPTGAICNLDCEYRWRHPARSQIPRIFAFAAANSSSESAPEACNCASFWICVVASSSTGAGAL